MRRRGELLESERAMLRELAVAPDYAPAISQRTGQSTVTVWKILRRLEGAGYLKRSVEGALRPRHVYRLTAKGRRAAVRD